MDPGLNVTGYGLVREVPGGLACVAYGAVRTAAGQPRERRLARIHGALTALLAEHRPAAVALEEPFVAVNVRSAFAIGEARAAVMLAAAGAGVPVYQYPPATVKQAVAGYGRGGKAQVQEMVRLQLGLASAPHPADAADALALAICHLAHRRAVAAEERRA
ncbi:MAG TPA: crossover junction endodeoxyribonuclease RuvC [Dehalococcoidia bacterium]